MLECDEITDFVCQEFPSSAIVRHETVEVSLAVDEFIIKHMNDFRLIWA
jgi:hypothetical protein